MAGAGRRGHRNIDFSVARKWDFSPVDLTNLAPYLAGLGLATSLLALGHWLPLPVQRKLPGSVLHLLGRYAYGVGSLWAGAGLWLGWRGQWGIVAGLLGLAIAGGLTVALAYGWDEGVLLIRQRWMAVGRDEELAE